MFYSELKNKFKEVLTREHLLNESIKVVAKPLTTAEAIGNPIRKDYPIIKGKEKLVEADFKGFKGQAFTDHFKNFSGTLKEILDLDLESNYSKAVFISSLNSVMKYLNLTQKTIHCKNEEPEICAKEFTSFVKNNYNCRKIALIGLQPAILEDINKNFEVRCADLDLDNIDEIKYGVKIEDGELKTNEILDWCDIALVTGSTIVNGSIVNFLDIKKPVIFFGTTIAAAAELMDLKRFCFCAV